MGIKLNKKVFNFNNLMTEQNFNYSTFLIVFNFLSTSGSPVNVTATLLTTDGPFDSSSPSNFFAFLASRFFFCFKLALDGAASFPKIIYLLN